MRIAIVGAGIVGVTTAYELAADGHDVTVFERRGSIAAEASFANAGVVGPASVAAWSGSALPRKALARHWTRDATLRVHPSLLVAAPGWMWNWWRAAGTRSNAASRARIERLAGFSRERLHALTRTLALDYERSDGCLVVLRSARDRAAVEAGLEVLRELGVAFDELDAQDCLRVEPGIAATAPLHGGIHFAGDEVANCRQFALLLRAHAQRLGVRFRFHTTVRALHPGARPAVTHEPLDAEAATRIGANGDATSREGPATVPLAPGPATDEFDAVVLCAALGAPSLLAAHDLRLPLVAVHSYALTAPLRHVDEHADFGPRSAVLDERHAVAITRLGKRVRVAGCAELGGSASRQDPRALAALHRVLDDWFAGAVRLGEAQHWKGTCATLPDGAPVLGASGVPGVWLNLGHARNGWALACGSARIVADAIAACKPAIAVDGLDVTRLLR